MTIGVELLPSGREETPQRGPTASIHEADLRVSAEAASCLLSASFLERVAAAYRRFLSRRFWGLLRVRLEPGYESVVFIVPRPSLLRLRAPVYGEGLDWAEVRWDIDRGLLVATAGQGRGSLRIRTWRRERPAGDGGGVPVLVRMEVEGYYPRLRGKGRFAPIRTWFYANTQARIHRHVMRGFLRSLIALELPPSGARSSVPIRRVGG